VLDAGGNMSEYEERVAAFAKKLKGHYLRLPEELISQCSLLKRREEGGSAAKHLQDYSRASTDERFSYLGTFLSDLAQALTDIPKEREHVLDSHMGYSFPSAAVFEHFLESQGVPNTPECKDNFCNLSPSVIQQFLANLVADMARDDGRRAVRIVAAKVGSGKTTFIKLLARGYAEFLEEHNTLLVSLWYDDYELENYRDKSEDEWKDAFLKLFDVHSLFVTALNTTCNAALQSEAFKEWFRGNARTELSLDVNSHQLTEDEFLGQISNSERTLLAVISDVSPEDRLLRRLKKLPRWVIRLALEYTHEVLEYRYLLVVDGL